MSGPLPFSHLCGFLWLLQLIGILSGWVTLSAMLGLSLGYLGLVMRGAAKSGKIWQLQVSIKSVLTDILLHSMKSISANEITVRLGIWPKAQSFLLR